MSAQRTIEQVSLPDEWEVTRFIKTLKRYEDYMKEKYKVGELGVFGSYTRNEQREGSDLDLLVKFYEPVGLDYFELKDFLEDVLKVNVDLVTKSGIKPRLKDRILKEVVYL